MRIAGGWVKGKPPEPRAARPRAWGATKRGLSGEQVPVLTALDNAGGVYEAILPSLTAIEAALDGRIAAGSVVCSDGVAAYVKAAVKAGAEHRRVVVPTITPVAVKVAPMRTHPPRAAYRICAGPALDRTGVFSSAGKDRQWGGRWRSSPVWSAAGSGGTRRSCGSWPS
jgi:hypothetical protein